MKGLTVFKAKNKEYLIPTTVHSEKTVLNFGRDPILHCRRQLMIDNETKIVKVKVGGVKGEVNIDTFVEFSKEEIEGYRDILDF